MTYKELTNILYNKATNRSCKSNNNTPKEDGLNTIPNEIDMAFNSQYNTLALKAFYNGSKNGYKLDFPIRDLDVIYNILKDSMYDEKSIF